MDVRIGENSRAGQHSDRQGGNAVRIQSLEKYTGLSGVDVWVRRLENYDFRSRKQAPNESLANFARGLLDLGRRVYPDPADARVRTQLQLEYFITNVYDGDISERLMMENFAGIFEALEFAQNVYTAKRARERLTNSGLMRHIDVLYELKMSEVDDGMDRLKLIDEIKTVVAEHLANRNNSRTESYNR